MSEAHDVEAIATALDLARRLEPDSSEFIRAEATHAVAKLADADKRAGRAEEPHAPGADTSGDSSPIDRVLTGPGQVLLAVTLVGTAVVAALWFRATALDPATSGMPGGIWAFPRVALTLGFFIAAAAFLERLGVPIYRSDEEAGGEHWRVWVGVLGVSGALFLLASLLLAWNG